MLIAVYFAISMLSAFLLFSVQPIAAKAMLPVLGGTPFVWNGCMLFFQTVLLGGYLYAHKVINKLNTRWQVGLHLGILLVAVLLFPSEFANVDWVSPSYHPISWLMGSLAMSIAIPFFALSATAPLIQAWFSRMGHARSENPYFLYAASNIGSFGSLIIFVVLIEPFLTRHQQLTLLHCLYAVLAALFIYAGLQLYRRNTSVTEHAATQTDVAPPSWRRVGYWLVLSFVPASLLYGVTLYITTDVASIPLLWVIPLALYLLTFVFVFGDRQFGLRLSRMLHVPVATAIVLIYWFYQDYSIGLMFVHLAAFYIIVMTCHGALSDARPPASQLTNFYLWVSLGGVLGGAFNTFVAHEIFTEITEYPVMIIISILVCIPPKLFRQEEWKAQTLMPGAAALAIMIVFYLLIMHWDIAARHIEFNATDYLEIMWARVHDFWKMMLGVMLCWGAYKYRMRNSVFAISLLVGASMLLLPETSSLVFKERNIFGVNKVQYFKSDHAYYFTHGTTVHGLQSSDEEDRLDPVSYYAPLRQVFNVMGFDPFLNATPIALMGLGAGTIACYGQADQRIDIFEIDPLVVKIANNPKFFTYLRDCPPKKNIEIGDARILLSQKPDNTYGIIIADAFTSDAVPTHLLTQEALAMYLKKLKPNGVVAFNVSNRHINLAPVLARLATSLDAQAYYLYYDPEEDASELEYASEWVVVTRNKTMGKRLLAEDVNWENIKNENPIYLWRDDFSNILNVLYW